MVLFIELKWLIISVTVTLSRKCCVVKILVHNVCVLKTIIKYFGCLKCSCFSCQLSVLMAGNVCSFLL